MSTQAAIDAVAKIPVIESILDVICRTTGMGFVAVAKVTDDQWVACAVLDQINFGLRPGGELKVETTICHEIRQHHKPVVIDQVSLDNEYVNHHTPALYGFESYISVPITLKNGRFFGTLCAIDPRPARLNTPEIVGMFTLYADLISLHLHAIEQKDNAELSLLEERKIAELREQFIAILGHDLRNPVGAVSNVAQLLLRMPLDDKVKRLATIVQDATFRIRELIENVLDFARGRLGEGIQIDLKENEPIRDILTQVITEQGLLFPDRAIEVKFDLREPVTCDGRRIAQLFSNLLSNALTHGEKEKPVRIEAVSGNGEFVLAVINSCQRIPGHITEKLFQPFSRGELKPGQQGLGLGLYIASEIARAHSGTLEVDSGDTETRFILRIPSL
jgi:signal transduction histidine kinase